MSALQTFHFKHWDAKIDRDLQLSAIQNLEKGKVLYLPSLAFPVFEGEKIFYNPELVDPKRKNISYDCHTDNIGGSLCEGSDAFLLKEMLKRYAQASKRLVENLFPDYVPHLKQSKTSFRPAEIEGRKVASIHKDDTRLHVDAFPSNPTGGSRILRVFTNVNPEAKPRVWKVGEPFEEVVKRFAERAAKPIPALNRLLKLFKVTKNLRTPYDHYMLFIHNKMKESDVYQKDVRQEEIHFPSGSSWIVFTDQVSHAALSGQHVFEQTFFIPSMKLKNPATSPLGILEGFLQRQLI